MDLVAVGLLVEVLYSGAAELDHAGTRLVGTVSWERRERLTFPGRGALLHRWALGDAGAAGGH